MKKYSFPKIRRGGMLLLALLAFRQIAWAQGLSGTGTSDDPYLINDSIDWNWFAQSVTNGTTYANQFVSLNNDITVSTMAGIENKCFSGTFDGQGHTITLDMTATMQFTALFCYADGATFRNLKVDGVLNTSKKFCAGLVGAVVYNGCTFTNCVSDVTINSTVNGDGSHGGFVSFLWRANTFEGCAFTGKLLGPGTTNVGGFVGFTETNQQGSVTFTNCLFIPEEVTMGTSGSQTFARWRSGDSAVTIGANCYYSQTLGGAQGKMRHSITGIKGANVDFRGSNTTYNVSGINAYSAGIVYDSTHYAGEGDTVSLALSHGMHPSYIYGAGYTASAGTLILIGIGQSFLSADEYYITMPDEDVTIEPNITAYTVSVETNLYGAVQMSIDNTTWSSSVIAPVNEVVYFRFNTPNGYAIDPLGLHIFTEEGSPVNYTGNHFNMPPSNVTVHAEFLETGGAIGDAYTVILSPGAGGGYPIIFNSSILSIADDAASAENLQFYHVNNNTLGFRLNGDYCPNSFIVPNGVPFLGWDGWSNGGYITLTSTATTFTAQFLYYIVTLSPGLGEGEPIVYTFNSATAAPDAASAGICQFYYVNYNTIGFRLPADYCPNSFTAQQGFFFIDWEGWSNDEYITLTTTETTFTARWGIPVTYIDGNGETHTRISTVLTGGQGKTTLSAGWYVVNSDITYSNNSGDALILNGDVTLILCNGKTMTVTSNQIGIKGNSRTLTIYGQSHDPNVAGTLNVYSSGTSWYGIHGQTYTQHSGNVIVSSPYYHAIYTKGFTLNGGSLQASGKYSGIDTSDDCDLIINGGTVTASSTLTDGTHAGIRAGGNVVINGGKVETNKIFATYNVSFGYTHLDDYIKSDDFYYDYYQIGSTVTVKDGQAFYYENDGGEPVTVSGTINNPNSTIAGKMLRPYNAPVTVTKDIAGYGNGNGGWYLIASPLLNPIDPATVGNLIADSAAHYDLYRFDQNEPLEWHNHKADSTFRLKAGKGYLYANTDSVTLTFNGVPYFGNGKVRLTKTAGVRFEGWNLIGNPSTTEKTIAKPFYRMNALGTEIIAAENNIVEAMEGIFVVADTDGEVVTFADVSRTNGKSEERIVLNLSGPSTGSETAVIDRAIVRFGEGQMLPKSQISNNSTKIYIPQDGKDYALVNVGGDGVHNVFTMDVHFKAAENGTYTLTANTDKAETTYLHLIDSLTGTDVDLLVTPTYTFTATTHDDASRFRLVFNAQSK